MSMTAGTKRLLPPKVAKMKERKRQKLQNSQNASQHSVENHTSAKNGPLRLDELKWREVELPDQMDDYEGFFGLEEIDGVEVVRDPKDGQVSYHMAGDKNQARKPFQSDGRESAMQNEDRIPQATQEDDEGWTGIEEDEEEHAVSIASKAHEQARPRSTNTKTETKKNTKDGNVQSVKPNAGKNGKIATASFTVLEDEDDSADADVSAWHPLDLSQGILSSLSKLGFARPTEIQASAIPLIRAGHDLIGKAPTGSGKTLAFGIPIIEEWLARRPPKIGKKSTLLMKLSALVIVPTRELAHQITAHLNALLSHLELDEKITITTITGGLSIQKQIRLISQAQIVVGTPGRLWEVIRDGHGLLEAAKQVKFLVLDEADRLLSEGHFKDLEELLSALDKEVTDETNGTLPQVDHLPISQIRQTLVFSATFSKTLHQNLSRRSAPLAASASKQDTMAYLLRKLNFRSGDTKPHFIDINPVAQMAANLREGFVECPDPTDKDLYLYALLLYHHPGVRALVFVNSIAAVRRLVPLLTNLGLPAFSLHSHMPQKARLRSVERFASASLFPSNIVTTPRDSKILVATDIAARGLDIPNITLVLHYSVPRTADAYVHRSGRTARATAAGSSILLCAPGEAAGVRRLVGQVHARALSPSSENDSDDDSGEGKAKAAVRSRPRGKFKMHHLTPSARLITALRPRLTLAKRIADAVLTGQKARKEEEFFREAKAELQGSDSSSLSSSDAHDEAKGRLSKPRRQKKDGKRGEREQLTKGELQALRAELGVLLKRKVNVGVSERYLVGRGGDQVERLLQERDGGPSDSGKGDATGETSTKPNLSVGFAGGMVLGTVEGLGWDIDR